MTTKNNKHTTNANGKYNFTQGHLTIISAFLRTAVVVVVVVINTKPINLTLHGVGGRGKRREKQMMSRNAHRERGGFGLEN